MGAIKLAYGTLPTHSALFSAAQRQGVTTGALLDLMRSSLRAHGPNEGLRQLLRALGFDWSEPPVSDLDLDVAAVADALNSPAVSSPDSQHRAVEPGAPSVSFKEMPFVSAGVDTNGGTAGEQLYPAHASRGVGELAELLGGGR